MIDEKNYSKGIYARLMDTRKKIIVIKILYNENYPQKPPIVHSTPPIRDVCWDSNGYLHFAIKKDHFSWNLFRKYSNPLVYLIDEIVQKYKTI